MVFDFAHDYTNYVTFTGQTIYKKHHDDFRCLVT